MKILFYKIVIFYKIIIKTFRLNIKNKILSKL